ncbi:MAG: aromatic ring-hydroxylating dioxygenase subunit alpha [Alphaproteobacteria bacterium]|nr:aromatic ring-hydroxylating dioxygenase subunit alpha [Alphaproteobacteria bacterium]
MPVVGSGFIALSSWSRKNALRIWDQTGETFMTSAVHEPFVRNAWYLAAWPKELEAGIVARTIMNQPLVLFRGTDGKAAALEDRCCHRGAPLSHGELVDHGLQCGYHGLVYDGTGTCIEVPGGEDVPAGASVRSYPVVERQQCIWIWMGDPIRADEAKIVEYPCHDQPQMWPHKKSMFQIKANYMMMIDNLMDLTHLAFVHRKTVGGNAQAHAAAELIVEPTETGCRYERWMMDSPTPPTYIKAVGFEGNIDRWHRFEYVGPSTVIQRNGAIDVGKGARESQDQPGFHLQILHHATPETETSFHYFWSAANGYRQDEPEATEQLYNEIYPTFLEDKAIMEAQQERLNLDPTRPLISIRADKALFYARKALHKMIEDDGVLENAAAE